MSAISFESRYRVCVVFAQGDLPKTPALLPTKVPRRVILLRTALSRTLKAGDFTAAVARFSAVFAADEAAAVEA